MNDKMLYNRFLAVVFICIIGPCAHAQLSPLAIGTIPAGKTLVVRYDVTVNNPTSATSITNQGVISGTNFASLSTNTTFTPIVSSNASLSALALSQGTLSPPFAASITAYSASVPNSVSSVSLTPRAEQGNATIAVNGTAVASGSPINVPLAVCVNLISVSVTAQDGVTTQLYSLTINRDAPPVTLIASSPFSCTATSVTLTATPGFASYAFSAGATQGSPPNTATITTVGSYSVTATAAGGCSSTDSQIISFSNTLVATAGASSSSALVGSVVSLSASGGSAYLWSAPAGASLSSPATSSAVSASLTTSGVKTFTVVVSQGTCSQRMTVDVTAKLPPDLIPLLYVTPSLAYSTTAGSVVVDVFELNSTPTSGTITVHISKSSLLSLSFDAGATSFLGHTVQNGVWSFDGTSSSDAYILTTTQVIGAGGRLSVGLSSLLTPGITKGTISVTATLVGSSGGEVTLTNNTDADQLDYFNK
jgi:hypothetical protein